jgi:hypothetical protein
MPFGSKRAAIDLLNRPATVLRKRLEASSSVEETPSKHHKSKKSRKSVDGDEDEVGHKKSKKDKEDVEKSAKKKSKKNKKDWKYDITRFIGTSTINNSQVWYILILYREEATRINNKQATSQPPARQEEKQSKNMKQRRAISRIIDQYRWFCSLHLSTIGAVQT